MIAFPTQPAQCGVRWRPGTLSHAQRATLVLLLTLLALVMGSGAWILALGLRMPSLMITAWLVVFIAQTSVVTLVMGTFDHLSSGWLGGASLLVALAEVTCALRWRRSFVGRSARSILTGMRSVAARAWRHPLVFIFGCVVLVAYGWILYLGVRLPAYNIIIGGNLPDSLAHEPGGKFGQIIGSWATDLHRHTYSYDQRLGGFGIQWPVILVPALAVAGVAWLKKQTQLIWLGIILHLRGRPVGRRGWVVGGGWWSRYTIFLPAAGCAALASVLEQLAPLRLPWRLAPTVIVLAFMAAATTSLRWAADPPNIVALPGGPHAATFKDAVNLTKLSAAQRAVSVYPWAIHTDLAAVPKGAAIGMFPDDLTFTHPFIGTDLRHELIPLTKTTSSSALAGEMRALDLHYVVFTEGTGVAYKQQVNSRLNQAVTADPQFHYTGLVGGVYGMYVYRLSS